MDDRDEWQERIREICACSTWWWWWWCFILVTNIYIYIYIYMCVCVCVVYPEWKGNNTYLSNINFVYLRKSWRNGRMRERKRERERERKRDVQELLWLTPSGDTYIQSTASFTRGWYRAGFSARELSLRGSHQRHDLSLLQTDLWGGKFSSLHIFLTPTYFTFDAIHRAFLLSLVYLKTTAAHPVYEIHINRLSKLNI